MSDANGNLHIRPGLAAGAKKTAITGRFPLPVAPRSSFGRSAGLLPAAPVDDSRCIARYQKKEILQITFSLQGDYIMANLYFWRQFNTGLHESRHPLFVKFEQLQP